MTKKVVNTMDEIERYLIADTPIIAVQTFEEVRFLAYLTEVGKKLNRKVYVRFGAGWRMSDGSRLPVDPNTIKTMGLLSIVPEVDDPAIFVFVNGGDTNVRELREFALYTRRPKQSLIVTTPSVRLHDDLKKDAVEVSFPLPSVDLLTQMVQRRYKVNRDDARILASEARGMTGIEFDRAMQLAINESDKLVHVLEVLRREKARAIKSSGLLEAIEPGDMKRIGGLALLKDWLQIRHQALTGEARDAGLPTPKGVLIVGMPGTGKSECAKAVAGEWNLPLIKLDPSRLYAKHVGDTEANTRHALQLLEATSPCVVWIDEIEKGLAGNGANAGDSGTAARLVGTLLTWMQERAGSVFVVATANAVENLPPELMRKGRFDEVFFVDLPNEEDRAAILSVVLERYGQDADSIDISAIAAATEGFSGAEIEESVRSLLYETFVTKSKITTAGLAKSVRRIIPLSATAAERMAGLKRWSFGRARPASHGDALTVKGGHA